MTLSSYKTFVVLLHNHKKFLGGEEEEEEEEGGEEGRKMYLCKRFFARLAHIFCSITISKYKTL